MTDGNRLTHYQKLVREFVAAEGAGHYREQFHPDLSPSGWHLGHCVFTENYWIREVVEGCPVDAADRDLYVPELSHKPVRGRQLPEFDELLDWAEREQHENERRLRRLEPRRHPLLAGGFLEAFLIQHYAQHYETLCQVRCQRRLRERVPDGTVRWPAVARPDPGDTAALAAGRYPVGQPQPDRPYDNEYPRHVVRLAGCRIARRLLNNGEYLGFMEAGGYRDRRYWSAAGWRWRQDHSIEQPCYWRADGAGGWWFIDGHGVQPLQAAAPVCGISYYEAEAVATWAGARLPHEHEWEAAARAELLAATGQVWEWCANAFYPYPGFRAWPYDGYSLPYFDDRHFVLRGGSRHTCRSVRRVSFRNYYEADKRHLFAGVRLVFD